MKKKRIISALIALVFIAGLPVSAFAAEWDVANGDITVNATSTEQTVTQGAQVDVPDAAPVITGSSASNTVTVKAEAGATANVTLSGVNIDVSNTGTNHNNMGAAAVSTGGAGNVSIELDGENTVKSGFGRAGVEKGNDGNLTIRDEDNNGSLNATGGRGGAGIGGGFDTADKTKYVGNPSNITISGGEVTAQGGQYAAGIGSGTTEMKPNSPTVSNVSDITVSGDARVRVQGKGSAGSVGAGIGSGAILKNVTWNDGSETDPDVSMLTKDGRIEYYAPDGDMTKDEPTKTIVGEYVPPQPPEPERSETAGASAPLYAKYFVIEGKGQQWTAGDIEFVLNSNAVIKVLIDGAEVEFTVADDGTVTIAAAVIKALEAGTHEIQFIFDDGSCKTTFMVK